MMQPSCVCREPDWRILDIIFYYNGEMAVDWSIDTRQGTHFFKLIYGSQLQSVRTRQGTARVFPCH